MVPKEILRSIAEAAGCHVYTSFPGQIAYSENYVSFFAHDSSIGANKCLIRLPARSRITDLYAGQVIACDSDVIALQVRENQALLFHYQPVCHRK